MNATSTAPRHAAAVVACAAVLVLGGSASPAWGHASLLGSTPDPGSRLEQSPASVSLTFSEPLNRRLSRATLVDARTSKRVETRLVATGARELVLRSLTALPRAPYRVDWHTVSTEDGHALEGSFGFGVQTAAVGGAQSVEQSPLAGGRWERVIGRTLLYATLLLFCGALLLQALLARPPSRSWLVPDALAARLGEDLVARVRARERALVTDLGVLAAGAAAAAALIEAADAAGSLSLHGLDDYLLANVAGFARIAVVGLALAGAWLAARSVAAAAGAAVLALGAVAVAGHAASSSPRAAGIVTDWAHLLGAATWLGGIALILLVWGPALRREGGRVRRALVADVLPVFGSVALPAFVVVAITGTLNALIQLGRVSALVDTSYGRVLLAKIALVGLIAAASYVHALRLRPRLAAGNPHPDPALERRHWRLLRSEPLLALGVTAAVAVLVAFPLPPRQLRAADSALAEAPCSPCPLPMPSAGELAVAEQAGSHVVAAWIRRRTATLTGEVRLLDVRGQPGTAPARVLGAVQASCGRGCLRFATTRASGSLRVAVTERGHRYVATLPAAWRAGGTRFARRLLDRAQRAMRALRSVREVETLTSGPGTFAGAVYSLQAPDRYAYVTNTGGRVVTIGQRQWFRDSSLPEWQLQSYGGGIPFQTRTWFRWTPYAQAVRLLGTSRDHGRPVAELALVDPSTPVWLRMLIDRSTSRVLRVRMIAKAHFMTQRFVGFQAPVTIAPPRKAVRIG